MESQKTLAIPEIKPERDYVCRYLDLPDPSSSLYITITKQDNADGSENHVISGMRVVFNRADDVNGLFQSYHQDPRENKLPDTPSVKGTIQNLTICADELVIYGELRLPETNVYIFARKLVFKDQDGNAGRITTSPLAYANKQAAGKKGADGRKAGNISVYIHDFETGDLKTNRFNLLGGNGQDAHPGVDGQSGNVLRLNVDYCTEANYGSLKYSFEPPAVYFNLECRGWGCHGAVFDRWRWGCNMWPKDGTDAEEPGKPGNAGDGGSFLGVLPSWVIETLQFFRDTKESRKTTQKMLAAAASADIAFRYAESLESLAKDFRVEQREQFSQAVKQMEELLHKSEETISVVHEALKPLVKVAGLLAEAEEYTQFALMKTSHFSEGKIPYERKNAALINNNAQQIRLLAGMAHERTNSAAKDLAEGTTIVQTSGGIAGEKAKDVVGGRPGAPGTTAKYHVKCYADPFGKLHTCFCNLEKKYPTKAGQSFKAQAAEKESGTDGLCEVKNVQDFGNAWLHPSLLQTFLLYVRDAYLISAGKMEQLVPILNEYATALQSLPPISDLQQILERSGVRFNESFYHQTSTEVVTLLHRIDSHLDYFGSPSGWTPLFSLPVCLQMYEAEVNEGLKTLVLAKWIQEKAAQAQEAATIASQSIESLNKQTDGALEQIEREKDNLKKLTEQAQALEDDITGLTVKLENKRTELMNKAEDKARAAAWINLGVSTICGICQVIPYGQPALGSLASAGKVIADNVINSDDPVKTVGPMSSLLADFTKAQLDNKAAQIVEAAKDKKDTKTEDAARKAAKLTQVGKEIGPALTGIADAIVGLNVPQSEVDGILRKLEAESPEFQELVRDLEALNVRKAGFLQRLTEGLQALSSAYSQVTSNLLAVSSMEHQRREGLSVLDHEALLYAKNMDQNARFMLVKYLYYLAKCYEYAVLEPIGVNYQLTEIFDKITPLLAEQDIDIAVTKLVDTLAPLFKLELRKIEDTLKTNFRPEYTGHLQIRLSADQTPDIVSQLNATGEAIINLRDFNCILPRSERIKIEDVEVQTLDFKADGQPNPESGSVEFTMEPLGDGTMRAGNALYVVRHPTSASSATVEEDSQQIWGVTYHFGGKKKMDRISPSKASLELLDSLLANTDKSVQEKIAKPAAWTDIKVRFARHVRAPDLESVILKWSLNWTQADDNYCVLDLRMCGRYDPLLNCSPDDTNGRGDGYGDIYRIYPRGTRIQLSAPPVYGKQVFSHWEVIDNTDTMESREVHENVLEIEKIHHNMQVFCLYEEKGETQAVIHKKPIPLQDSISAHFASLPNENEIESFLESDEFREFEAKIPELLAKEERKLRHGCSSAIFNEPKGFPVGYLPPKAKFTVLEGAQELDRIKWQRIDYRGTVGWVTTVPTIPEENTQT